MTIREAIKESLDTYIEYGSEFGNDEQEPPKMLQVIFPKFLEAMALILTQATLQQNGINPMEEITGEKLLELMDPNAFTEASFQRTFMLDDFIRWFLDQEAVCDANDDGIRLWYSVSFVVDAWNRWINDIGIDI